MDQRAARTCLRLPEVSGRVPRRVPAEESNRPHPAAIFASNKYARLGGDLMYSRADHRLLHHWVGCASWSRDAASLRLLRQRRSHCGSYLVILWTFDERYGCLAVGLL